MGKLVQASSIDIYFVIVEGDRRLESMSEELSTNHLIPIKIEVVTKFDHIAWCRCVDCHWRVRILLKGNGSFIIDIAELSILQHRWDERNLIFYFHSALLSFVSDKIQRISNLA